MLLVLQRFYSFPVSFWPTWRSAYRSDASPILQQNTLFSYGRADTLSYTANRVSRRFKTHQNPSCYDTDRWGRNGVQRQMLNKGLGSRLGDKKGVCDGNA